jgi:tetratricopeptide (TPR) repeat protein
LPESFQFYYRRGLQNLREGAFEDAVDNLRQASHYRQDYADVQNYLGVAHGEMEHWEEAIGAFRRALDASGDYHVARLNLGFALASIGRDEEACQELQAVLAADPANQPATAKLEELSGPRRDRIRVQDGSRD